LTRDGVMAEHRVTSAVSGLISSWKSTEISQFAPISTTNTYTASFLATALVHIGEPIWRGNGYGSGDSSFKAYEFSA